jgi:tetratricopeptide (TPR) repeat protein
MRFKRDLEALPVDLDALYEFCFDLETKGRLDEAVLACQTLVDRFGEVDAADVRLKVEHAMRLKYHALARKARGRPGNDPAVLEAVDELIHRFRNAAEVPVRQGVALTLSSKLWWLIEAGHYPAAIDVVERLAEQFENERDPALEKEIGDLLIRASKWLRALADGDPESAREALRVATVVTDGFRDTPDEEAARLYVRAQLHRIQAMSAAGRAIEEPMMAAMAEMADIGQPALDVLQKLAQDNDGSDPALDREEAELERIYGASLWITRASVLSEMGRIADALAAIDDVEERFKNDPSASVQNMISQLGELRQAVREDGE